jgi:hypothetical protein
MSLGALWLKLRQKYGHGLRTAYYRDFVRPRILDSAPVTETSDDSCEIHALTSSLDWLNLVWALKSFYFYSGRKYRLCIHDDGTLSADQVKTLQCHFPGARLIGRGEADSVLHRVLEKHPRSHAFRESNPLALKVFDLETFLECHRMMLIDSDFLFFTEPMNLLQRIEDHTFTVNSLNRDWGYAYSIDFDSVAVRLPFNLLRPINSGLGLVHKSVLRLDWIEEFLGLPNILSHNHRIEQTLIALCCCRYGFEFLPVEYDVHLGGFNSRHPCRHYTGPIRHRMYSEGIPYLRKRGFPVG